MTIAPGVRLGAYEITALIGAGGMGRVYRARDTRLKRDVAIKVLPDAFAADADRLTRFHREAEVLASLNHFNIAAIHDVVDADRSPVLVMEFVEGETLAEVIRRGPLAVDEALGIARQIADGLEAAHDRGILHRDLKPANVKITADDHVKILDFGLAKLTGLDAGSGHLQPDLTASPTMMLSGAGVIVGTAAYMSPEQARGKAVDRTTDVWAFGCVLYEMLAGRAVFEGDTANEILGGVFKQEPDWSRLPDDTPPAIRRLLRQCLQKDRRQRLKDIGDARLEIEEALSQPGTSGAATLQKPRRTERWAWIAAAILALIATLAIAWAMRPVAPAPEMRVEITTPSSTDFVSMALAPDGQTLVYVAAVDGLPRLWLRPLGGSARPLAETDGAVFPFWSPDGRSIGFFADGKLKRIDVGGAAAQTLAAAGSGRGGTWHRNGVILFVPNAVSPIFRVSAQGGDAVAVTRVDRPRQISHRFPVFLPDGRHFLFHVSGVPDARGIYVGSLDGSDPVRLCDSDSGPVLAPFGRLLYVRQNTLFVQQLDLDRLTLVGSPVSIATSVAFDGSSSAAAVTASAAGSIAYRSGAATGARQFLWFDRTGKKVGEIGSADMESPFDPELSPDGRRLAMTRLAGGNGDIWLTDVARGVLDRFTFDPANDLYPIWSPDGSRLAFSSGKKGNIDLYQKASSGAGAEETLLESPLNKGVIDWSHDGRFILYRQVDPKTGINSLWALPVIGEGKPFAIVGSTFEERDGQFSPDGKWIAYRSNESGRFEVYVQAFPTPKGKWRVSTAGGSQPRWRRDGQEIFYIGLDGKLMAAAVQLNPTRPPGEIGNAAALFPTRIAGGALPGARKHQYDVSADGQRFLINSAVEESTSTPITLILNWKPPEAR